MKNLIRSGLAVVVTVGLAGGLAAEARGQSNAPSGAMALRSATAPETAGAPTATGARGPRTPASATLVLKKDTAVLEPAQAGAAFAAKLKALKPGDELPVPPSVDLVLRITNISPPLYRNPNPEGTAFPTTPVTLSPKFGVGIRDADKVAEIELLLEGPGAITMEGKASIGKGYGDIYLEMQPGESADIPITNLVFSVRGKDKAAYWTEPGTYTLKAIYSSGYQSMYGGGRGGALPLKVTSNPVTIKVTAK